MFGSIGMTELIVIMVVALLVIGPNRLPEMARSIGRMLGDLKRTTSDLQNSFSLDDDLDYESYEEREPRKDASEPKDEATSASSGSAETDEDKADTTSASQPTDDKATESTRDTPPKPEEGAKAT